MKKDIDGLCVDTLRLLAVEMVATANSGHQGLPLGAAHLAHTLFSRHLRHAPQQPGWPNRDRFVLSAGHGSALLYSMLHLTGYDVSLQDLKDFRQLDSNTPGHPEVHVTPGVETTTGPLGQGCANAVGMAVAERMLAERFNREGHEIVDHRTYALVGDGDLMEGVSYEAASLAGHLGLGKLTFIYDDNDITIDGSTDITFSEDVGKRFESCGWHVQDVDGHDIDAIDAALSAAAAETDKPSILVARTRIGLDSVLEGKNAAHGAGLGADEIKQVKAAIDWPVEESFHVPGDALGKFREAVDAGQGLVSEWESRLASYGEAHPKLADEWARAMKGELPGSLFESLPAFSPEDGKVATRKGAGAALAALAEHLPDLVGGSADLAGSNNSYIKGRGDFGADHGGRNVHFGIREHAMASLANGMALHGGLRPYVATFMIFSDYLRPTLRLAAMGGMNITYVMTHDSIGVGEDGPTHQPVEHLASLRAIPGLTLIRPADANEAVESWRVALEREGPVMLALSRQGLPVVTPPSGGGVTKGAYVLREAANGTPDILLLATGSEVHVALEAADLLEKDGGPSCRVVSMPSWELFSEQDQSYRDGVLPPAVKARVAMEAGVGLGWERWVGDAGEVVCMHRFGASAPAGKLFTKFGFEASHMAELARRVLSGLN